MVVMDAWDWVLECDGGVDMLDRGDGDENRADLGRPLLLGTDDGDPALANGIWRRCAMDCEVEDMGGDHQPLDVVCRLRHRCRPRC